MYKTNREKSKEALQKIKDFKVVIEHQSGQDEIITPVTEYYAEPISIIEKDLEVLEILKNTLKIKKSDIYGFEIVVHGSDEQENKIKEWLENEQCCNK